MRSGIVAAVIALAMCSSGALGACPYYTADGRELSFVDDGDNTVLIQHRDGKTELCSWGRSGETGDQDIACDGGEGYRIELFREAGTMVFRGERWEQKCFDYSAWDQLKEQPNLRWSTTSVAPFPEDDKWAAGYLLRPLIDDQPQVLRSERITAPLGARDIDTEFEAELVTLKLANRIVQELHLVLSTGGDGYTVLRRRSEGARFDKLAVRDNEIMGLVSGTRQLVDLDWRKWAKEWVELNYPNPSAWEGVLAYTGPVPLDRATQWMDRWNRRNDMCRGGAGNEAATLAACDERDALYDEIVDVYGYCYGTLEQAAFEYEWHICGRNSNR